MDVLKLQSRFMRGIISNLITKTVSKKLGYDIDIQLTEVQITNEDGKIKIHMNADAEVNNDEFLKIVKKIGLD